MRLGLTADEFYALSPRTFAAMRREWWRSHREQLAMFASLRMELINRSFVHAEHPIGMEELIPNEHGGAVQTAKRERMTARRRGRVADRLRAVMASFPGGLIVQNTAREIVNAEGEV